MGSLAQMLAIPVATAMCSVASRRSAEVVSASRPRLSGNHNAP